MATTNRSAASDDTAPRTGEVSGQRYLEPAGQRRAWSWSHRRHDEEEADPGPLPEVDDRDVPVYVISVAAELSELHPQTLRAYEREGLITPARTEGGTRRYSRRDVERLRFIRTLTQDEGLNLAGVKVVLEMGEKLEAARRRIGELEEMVRVLADRIEQRPAGDRFEIVKAPGREMEIHPHLRRRTAQRGSRPADPRGAAEPRARAQEPRARVTEPRVRATDTRARPGEARIIPRATSPSDS